MLYVGLYCHVDAVILIHEFFFICLNELENIIRYYIEYYKTYKRGEETMMIIKKNDIE